MQESSGQRPYGTPRRSARRHAGRLGPILMFLLVLGMGLVIAYREIPVVRDFLDGLIDPSAHRAVLACREAALAASRSPEFAVVARGGEAQATPGGFVVRNLVVGEMVPGEGEVRVSHTCHVDREGTVVQLHRSPPAER
jgi:hypothetical protein